MVYHVREKDGDLSKQAMRSVHVPVRQRVTVGRTSHTALLAMHASSRTSYSPWIGMFMPIAIVSACTGTANLQESQKMSGELGHR